MKKYKVRKNSIADRTLRAAAVLDKEPWSYIAFTITWIMIIIACGLAYNSVVPMYQ